MKDEIVMKEQLKLTEKELQTVVDKLQELESSINEVRETCADIKAIKLFLSRTNPDFKSQYAEICKKLNITQTE